MINESLEIYFTVIYTFNYYLYTLNVNPATHVTIRAVSVSCTDHCVCVMLCIINMSGFHVLCLIYLIYFFLNLKKKKNESLTYIC